MTSKNTTNYYFLKKFKPELYKLAVKMEEDLLIAPISMLAYATRFLEYILYDIAKSNDYKVNAEIGFADNIKYMIQLDFIDFDFGVLLIEAYHYRNSSIHNTDISKSLKEDRKKAFELNRRLFDIADVYYKTVTNDFRNHSYEEPEFPEKDGQEFTSITKQEKVFDTCIICGEPNNISKSNFCQECDNLLNYYDVLANIVSEKGKNAILKKDDFNYPFKNQLIDDLLSRNVLEQVGNNYTFVNDNLDDYFKLMDEFMEIDEFLVDFDSGIVKDYRNSKFYVSNDYPCRQVSRLIDNYYIWQVVKLMENGFSLEYSLDEMDVEKSTLDDWYDDKKSEFLEGYKDELFCRYNELLIRNLFKSIEIDNLCEVDDPLVEFWCQNFEGFSKNLSNRLAKQKLRAFINLFKMDSTREDALNEVGLDEEEFDKLIGIHKRLADEYFEEIERRKNVMLTAVTVSSLNEALTQSKLDFAVFNMHRTDFLNGNKNEFYRKLTEILQKRYLDLRKQGLSTHEICDELTVDESEVKTWFDSKEFMIDYQNARLDIFKNALSEGKSKSNILKDLEITEKELNEYISLGKSGNKLYFEYYDYFENRYYQDKFNIFINAFEKKPNYNLALKEAGLTEMEFDEFMKSNENYDAFEDLKLDLLSDYLIKKGKMNEKFLKKMGMTKKDYNSIKSHVDQLTAKKQLNLITEDIIGGELVYKAAQKVNCNWRDVFEWIYKGSVGDEDYEELAEEYFSHNIKHLNEGNDKLRKGDPISALKKNINPRQLGKYDFEYWEKWGLIDKSNHGMTVEDIKSIINKNNS